MNIPKITATQILAIIGFAGGEAINYGLLSGRTEHLIVGIAAIVLPGVMMIADAIIHHAYAKINVAMLETEAKKVIAELEANKHSTPKK